MTKKKVLVNVDPTRQNAANVSSLARELDAAMPKEATKKARRTDQIAEFKQVLARKLAEVNAARPPKNPDELEFGEISPGHTIHIETGRWIPLALSPGLKGKLNDANGAEVGEIALDWRE